MFLYGYCCVVEVTVVLGYSFEYTHWLWDILKTQVYNVVHKQQYTI